MKEKELKEYIEERNQVHRDIKTDDENGIIYFDYNIYVGITMFNIEIKRLNFRHCIFRDCKILNSEIEDVNFRSSIFINCELRKNNISKCRFFNTNIKDTNIKNNIIEDNNLIGIIIRDSNIWTNTINKNDMRNSEIKYTNIYDNEITKNNMSDMEIERADLSNNNEFDNYNFKFKKSYPSDGDFIGWKRCAQGRIVKLLIPAYAKKASSISDKCRCNIAKVLDIEDENNENKKYKKAISIYDKNFVYRKGQEIKIDDYEENERIECAPGIHFFIDKERAKNYD